MIKRVTLLKAIAMAALAALAGPAFAGSVVLWPINPSITGTERATALWLENRGQEPVTLQVRAFGWKQDGGEDQFVQQDEVVSSPPIATVAPGKRQLVRVVRRDTSQLAKERSYRLLIDEVPTPASGERAAQGNANLAIQMRYSIPLFMLDPATNSQASLDVRFVAGEDGRFVEIRNRGDQHARLINLRLVHGAKTFQVLTGLVGYVLPGATMRWALPADAPLVGSILLNVNGADQLLTPNA